MKPWSYMIASLGSPSVRWPNRRNAAPHNSSIVTRPASESIKIINFLLYIHITYVIMRFVTFSENITWLTYFFILSPHKEPLIDSIRSRRVNDEWKYRDYNEWNCSGREWKGWKTLKFDEEKLFLIKNFIVRLPLLSPHQFFTRTINRFRVCQ